MIKLKPELTAELDTATGLQTALQTAIMLEHATLPPYLYASWSLSGNREISDLIDPIVMQEMSHMALACNILNAIGGSPVIDEPKFVPTYPGPLPGGVEGDLTVPLAPFSIDLVYDVFMVIEEPEDPIARRTADGDDLTIGQFYEEIEQQIVAQGPGIFTGAPTRQVEVSFPDIDVNPVTNVDTARTAIQTIVHQGEGTTQSPDASRDEPGELAHFYRFAEIYHGKALIPNTSPPPAFVFEGDAIPFDSNGVLPVVSNPKATAYPAGSPARIQCDEFNATYTRLLRNLHLGFNGTQDSLTDAMFSDMPDLKSQGTALMRVSLGDGRNAGPSFEFQSAVG
jgi:ferritin-like protein